MGVRNVIPTLETPYMTHVSLPEEIYEFNLHNPNQLSGIRPGFSRMYSIKTTGNAREAIAQWCYHSPADTPSLIDDASLTSPFL